MTDNFSVECPNGHGKVSGYLSPQLPLEHSCPVCGEDMPGYRILAPKINDEVDIDELADMMMLNPDVSSSELLEFLREEAKARRKNG